MTPGGYFRLTLTPFCICYGIILFAATAGVQMMNGAVSGTSDPDCITSRLTDCAGSQAPVILALVIPIAAVTTAMLLFHYLFSDVSVNMLHALPVRREAHFGSVFLAGMTLLLIPVVVCEVVMMLFSAGIGSGELALLHLKLLGLYAAGTFLFFSIAALCAMLSAHILMLPIFYVVVNFLSLWIGVLIWLLRSAFWTGMGEFRLPRVLSALCPICELANGGTRVSYIYESAAQYAPGKAVFSVNGRVILGYLLAAVGIVVLSVWLYRRRAVECAGEGLAFRTLRWPLQALAATVTGVILAGLFALMSYGVAKIAIIMLFLAGAAIGFLAVRMLIQRKFRVFRSGWKGLAVFAALSLVILLGACFDVAGIETRVPEAEKVESVVVLSDPVSDPGVIGKTLALHSQIVSDFNALNSADAENTRGTDGRVIHLEYVLKNGRTVVREYSMAFTDEDLCDETSLAWQYFDILNDPAVTMAAWLPGEDFEPADLAEAEFEDFSGEWGSIYIQAVAALDLERLAEALVTDIQSGRVVTCMSEIDGDPDRMNSFFRSETTVYDQGLRLVVRQSDGSRVSRSIQLQEGMTETIAVLSDIGMINVDRPLTSAERERG